MNMKGPQRCGPFRYPHTSMEDTKKTSELQILLLRHFAPATLNHPKAKEYTTSKLFGILDEHRPGVFSPHELYNILHEHGFQDRFDGDELVWLVRPSDAAERA